MFEPYYILVYHAWNDIKYFPRLTPERSLLRLRRPQTPQGGTHGSLLANPFIYDLGPLDRWLGHSQLYARLRIGILQVRLGTVGTEGVVTDAAARASGGFSPLGPAQFALNLRLIVTGARTVGARPVLATEARLVNASTSPADRRKIAYEFVGLSHDALVRAFEACDRAILTVGRDEEVPVLDLSGRLSGRPHLFEDHVHTTAAGSEALGPRDQRLPPERDRGGARAVGSPPRAYAASHLLQRLDPFRGSTGLGLARAVAPVNLASPAR